MTKTQQNGKDALGALDQKNLTPAMVKEWVRKDVQTSLALLNAIVSDEDMLLNLATFLHGRLLNAIEKKKQHELENQTSN